MSSSLEELEEFRIPLDEIIEATKKFSTKIGDGGFGMVYKGQLSAKWRDRVAAFKCLDPKGYQGSDEFYNEVKIVSKFKHSNIIPFIGFCDEANNMIIVYEYAINGSLDWHLPPTDKKLSLTWAQRLDICLGAATGLLHLHSGLNDHCLIHRDVKSANILLDNDLKAKICDFGLSRFSPRNLTNVPFQFTKPAGTRFYMDPGYNETWQLSKESDVYSFGVVLFEMLRGTLAYREITVNDGKQYLIGLVRSYRYNPKKLIDPGLSDDIDEGSFKIFTEIAYKCINRETTERPLMASVVKKIQEAVQLHIEKNNSTIVTSEAAVKTLQIHVLYPDLQLYQDQIEYRMKRFSKQKMLIEEHEYCTLKDFAKGYLKFGLNIEEGGIVYREWAPAVEEAQIVGDFNQWDGSNHKMKRHMFGVWRIKIDEINNASAIPHDTKVKFRFKHNKGDWIDRVPAWINCTTAADEPLGLDGIYRDPRAAKRYIFENKPPSKPDTPHIYTARFGRSSFEPRVNSYQEFADNILQRVKDNKYNTVLLMGVMEHDYHGSFGYHVTNFFAVNSISGTPKDLKILIDKAHKLGLRVLMDIVHSHASMNLSYGLNGFDVGQATQDSYFLNGPHKLSNGEECRFFNYSNWEVLRFLLSNLSWWLEEFMFDGFRFHGVTSMLYHHHGINNLFTGKYDQCFDNSVNVDAVVYMMLANYLIHLILPDATVIADDVSGMPGLCLPVDEGGIGFDFG